MLIRKAYKFRLYPTPEQIKRLAVQFGHARFVYNHFLQVRQEKYAETGVGLNYQSTARELTQMKRCEEYAWLREADSQVLQQSLMDLEKGYHNFFAKRAGYPKYKGRKSKESIRYPQRVKASIEEKRTSLPKVGWVRTVYHRPIQGEIKNVTVSRTKSGRYFASFQVEMEQGEPEYEGKPNGIDLGLRDVVVLADGRKYGSPRYLIRAERKLRRLMQGLSRKCPGSKGREAQRQLVARLHEKVTNQRTDFLHKLSRELVEEHSSLMIETLNIRGMIRNRRLAKGISDVGWGELVRQLEYKGAWYGCQVVKVDRWYPSSKTCSNCGYVIEGKLPLGIRQWRCPQCGCEHDRDINAARNIKKQTTVGTTESKASGVHIRPERTMLHQARTMKLEAPQLAAE